MQRGLASRFPLPTMIRTLLLGVALGLLGGALFGAAFGAFASVFDGGPAWRVGVAESWWWFALAGAGIGFGVAYAAVSDRRRGATRRAGRG